MTYRSGDSTPVAGQLGRNLASELLPALQIVADKLLKFAEASGIFSTIAKAAPELHSKPSSSSAPGNVAFVLEGMGREIGAVAAQMVALAASGL